MNTSSDNAPIATRTRGSKRKFDQIDDRWNATPLQQRRKIKSTTSESKPKRFRAYKKQKIHHQIEQILWSEWKEIFLLGTEWENQQLVHDYKWDFNHLEEMLQDENSILHAKKQIHLFGSTEVQAIGSSEVVQIPVITAIVSDMGPLGKVGVTSVQKQEEIVAMESMKLAWKPIYSEGFPRSGEEPNVFFLHCNERRANLANVKKQHEEAFHRYQYLLAYHSKPSDLLDSDKQLGDPVVHIVDKVPGINKGINVEHNWMEDDMEDTLTEAMEDFELTPKRKVILEEKLLELIALQKAQRRRKMAACIEAYDDYSEEMRENLETLKTYKFYPQNSVPDVSSVEDKKVNRYFGDADAVFPPIPQRAPLQMWWPVGTNNNQ